MHMCTYTKHHVVHLKMHTSNYINVCVLSHFSHVQLFVSLWTAAHQAPLSVGFFRQEYWSRLPFPPLGDLPDPGIEPASPVSPAVACRFFTSEPPVTPHFPLYVFLHQFLLECRYV